MRTGQQRRPPPRGSARESCGLTTPGPGGGSGPPPGPPPPGRGPVTTADGQGLFDDVVGAGALVLASQSLKVDKPRQQALADVGIAVVSLGPTPATGVVVDDTGAYGSWLAELGVDAVLIRPDFAVYGTANADDVVGLVDEYLGQLGHVAGAPQMATSAP